MAERCGIVFASVEILVLCQGDFCEKGILLLVDAENSPKEKKKLKIFY